MPQAVTGKLLLYADNSYIIYQNKDVKAIENNLNKGFQNLYNWFIDNKLSLHFREDKTKSILKRESSWIFHTKTYWLNNFLKFAI